MTFLYLLLAVIFLIALILFSSIRIKLEYDNKLSVNIYFGILKIPEKMLNRISAKKDKKTSKETSKSENKKEKKKENTFAQKIKNKGICESFNIFIEFLNPVLKVLLDFCSKVTLNPLIVKIKIANDDAAQTAIEYGKFCSVYYPALKILTSKVNCKNIDSNVFVSYTDRLSEVYLKTQIKIRLIHCLTHAISIIVEFFKLKNKFE